MELGQRIEDLIAPTVADMGYDIVRVQVTGNQRQRLQVMAERRDGQAITVDDCAEISRAVSAILDVEDPISGAYTLEVSSPGIDRPLTRLADFDRFAGLDARVETEAPVDGRRRFRGRLLGTEGESVKIRQDDTVLDIPFGAIHRAKLILTDELLAMASRNQQH